MAIGSKKYINKLNSFRSTTSQFLEKSKIVVLLLLFEYIFTCLKITGMDFRLSLLEKNGEEVEYSSSLFE